MDTTIRYFFIMNLRKQITTLRLIIVIHWSQSYIINRDKIPPLKITHPTLVSDQDKLVKRVIFFKGVILSVASSINLLYI